MYQLFVPGWALGFSIWFAGGVVGLPFASSYDAARPVPSATWFVPVPPMTAWW